MKKLVVIYFVLSSLSIAIVAITPLSFQTDFGRTINWLVIISVSVSAAALLLVARETTSILLWKIGLALVIVCLCLVLTSVKYFEEINSYSWRLASAFKIKLELSQSSYELIEIINLLFVPILIVLDIYLWGKIVKRLLERRN